MTPTTSSAMTDGWQRGRSTWPRRRNQIFHTYSTYERGLDMLNVAYHSIDLVPKGRDEGDAGLGWVHRRDEYPD